MDDDRPCFYKYGLKIFILEISPRLLAMNEEGQCRMDINKSLHHYENVPIRKRKIPIAPPPRQARVTWRAVTIIIKGEKGVGNFDGGGKIEHSGLY